MSLGKRIAFNTIIHTLGKFGASAIGILVVAILTRHLGVEGYGAYTTIFAYLFFFAILSDLGLYVVTINELSRSEWGEEKFFNNIFTLRLVSGLVLMILASALVWVFPYSLIIKIGVMVASLSILLNLLDQMVVAFFQNKINMKRVAIAELVGKIVLLLVTIWFVSLNKNLIWIIGAIIIGFAINFGINLNYLRQFIKLKLAFEGKVWQSILKLSWPIAITSVFSLIYFKADTLFLSVLPVKEIFGGSNNEVVGIYGAPYKILEVLIVLPAIFMGLVSPILSRSWAEKKIDEFISIWQKSFDAIAVVVWPLIAGAMILAWPIMKLIAGNEFFRSALVFQILIWATGIIFITHLTTYSIIAMGRQKQMIKYYVVAAILAVIGYIFLIPKYSYLAAASVTVGVEFFMLLTTLYLIKKNVNLKINLKIFGKAFMAAVVMGGILYLIKDLSVLFLIVIGGAVYFGFLFLFKGVGKDFIKEVLRK